MLEARNLRFSVSGKYLLSDVSIKVSPGQVVGVAGPNGAGKSMLLKILSGDLKQTGGDVYLDGRPLSEHDPSRLAKSRAVLPQMSSLTFPFKVHEVVLMGRSPHVRGVESRHDYKISKAALEKSATEHLAERTFPTLSGGEQQRVHLARVLAQIWEPIRGAQRYLLLDEPTTSLDLAHQHRILTLARKFAEDGVGVLAVLHDLNLAAEFADRILLLKDGKTYAEGVPDEILTPEIVSSVFDVAVRILRHPDSGKPLIVVTDTHL